MNLYERYAQYQDEAVEAIVEDFRENPSGRYLLVVPTGGGKTWTAVRAISKLYDQSVLKVGDRVLWVAHRTELLTQAGETFDDFAEHVGQTSVRRSITFSMLSAVPAALTEGQSLRLIVIDEAHHGAAPSYQPLFRGKLGVLGLTATPSRHDGLSLGFERESYSIGFPELIERGILVRPEIIQVEGGRFEGVKDLDSLDDLNDDGRNQRILDVLEARQAEFRKVIIYAAGRENARALYRALKSGPIGDHYQSIGYILGGERARYDCGTKVETRDEPRGEFIAKSKSSTRSVLVNVDVLTEGYDDPSVNVVVMARPTSSKLVYMQAMGRAVRLDPNDPDKSAFVVELVDDLPNIRYRIDNRWLYSDISDVLEPAVEDRYFARFEDLPEVVETVLAEHDVPEALRVTPEIRQRDRVSALLFKVYEGHGTYGHVAIVITRENRTAVANFHNFIAVRMAQFEGRATEAVFRAAGGGLDSIPALSSNQGRATVFQAMENAYQCVQGGGVIPAVSAGAPWITFVAFRQRSQLGQIGADLMDFTEAMFNREPIRERLRSGEYDEGFVLLKLPLPLRGYLGRFVPSSEHAAIAAVVSSLDQTAVESEPAEQWEAAMRTVGGAAFPLEQRFRESPMTIVREKLDYFRVLEG